MAAINADDRERSGYTYTCLALASLALLGAVAASSTSRAERHNSAPAALPPAPLRGEGAAGSSRPELS